VGVPHVAPEGPGPVVVQQRVDHAVGRRQAQRDHGGALQRHREAAGPRAAHGVQVQGPHHVVGQEAEQEGRRHHGDQAHRAPPAAAAGAVDVGAGREAADEPAVAHEDGEEREQEAEGQRHVVQDQDTPPGGGARRLEAPRRPCPETHSQWVDSI